MNGVRVSPFFFSSRRRHTRCLSDWSSDVCSSDLALVDVAGIVDAARDLGDADAVARLRGANEVVERDVEPLPRLAELLLHPVAIGRSEERRVGKEGT